MTERCNPKFHLFRGLVERRRNPGSTLKDKELPAAATDNKLDSGRKKVTNCIETFRRCRPAPRSDCLFTNFESRSWSQWISMPRVAVGRHCHGVRSAPDGGILARLDVVSAGKRERMKARANVRCDIWNGQMIEAVPSDRVQKCDER